MALCALSVLAGLAGLFVAALHGWIFVQDRASRAHLWFAATALGIATGCFAGAPLFGAEPPPHALRWEQLRIGAAAWTLVAFLHFTAAHLRLEIGRGLRVAGGLGALGLVAFATAPSLLFRDEIASRALPAFGTTFHAVPLTPLGETCLTAFLLGGVVITGLWVRAWWRGNPEARALLPLLGAWLGAGAVDVAAALRLWSIPPLLVGSYLVLLLGISAVLTRRIAILGANVEQLVRRLHRRAEERAQELRARDLQLARGEQLAALGTLSAGVAHEINNPLAYVSANLNHLEEVWEKREDRDEVEDVLADCRDGLERVRAITVGLVRLARRGEARFEPVDVSEVVRSVLPMLRQEARSRARIVERLGDVPAVRGNPHLLGQVVLNLTLNAIQSIEPGAPDRNRVEIRTEARDREVLLTVEDTGGGIPEALQSRIFDPFFTTKEEGRGTGLGLAVTRQIVTRHRGDIRLASGPEGTRITVCLPSAAQTAAHAA